MKNLFMNQATMRTKPQAPQDIATKEYVDRIMWQDVVAATAEELAGTFAEPTLTGTAFTLPAIDGYTAAVGDRILVKDQTVKAQNGVYEVVSLGDGSADPWVLTRAEDATTAEDFRMGKQVAVTDGTDNKLKTFLLASDTAEDLTGDKDFSEYFVGDAGTDKVLTFVGDGVKTSFEIEHNLGSKNLIVATWENDGTNPETEVIFGKSFIDNDKILLDAGDFVAPATSTYTVVIRKA